MARSPEIPEPEPSGELVDYEAAVAGYIAAGANETVQRVVTALSRVSKRLDEFYRDQLADLELQRGDWGVLQELALQEQQHGLGGCSSPSRLADVVGVSPSTMTHRLDQLEKRGLLERSEDPDNRTRSRVGLTRRGRDLFRHAVLDADVAESKVLASLSDKEQRQLADILEKLLAR
jgi:DNA-binding MarR family transcriptional regulator